MWRGVEVDVDVDVWCGFRWRISRLESRRGTGTGGRRPGCGRRARAVGGRRWQGRAGLGYRTAENRTVQDARSSTKNSVLSIPFGCLVGPACSGRREGRASKLEKI